MNNSPQLDRPLRSYQEVLNKRREIELARVKASDTPEGRMFRIRDHLEQAETEAKRLSDEVGGDADERAMDFSDFIARDLIPDYLVPLENTVKEWLDEQEERDAPVGKMR